MKFQVDRRTWGRGGNFGNTNDDNTTKAKWLSYLRHPQTGFQCCIGFRAKAAGFTDEEITGLAFPSAMMGITVHDKERLLKAFPGYIRDMSEEHDAYIQSGCPKPKLSHSVACLRLANVNDSILGRSDRVAVEDVPMTEEEREKKLTVLFASIGDEVEFIN